MGILSGAREAAAAKTESAEAGRAAFAGSGCIGKHYETEVHISSGLVVGLDDRLNKRFANGYRLIWAQETGKQTVLVFEHHWH